MIDERKLLFYRKLLVSNNVLIRTLMCVTGVYIMITFLSAVDILFWIHTVPVWGVFADGVIL